jgi:hypothetical protein
MVRSLTAALLAALVLTPFAAAEDKADKGDKKAAKPLGAWSRKLADDSVVTFTIEADKMRCEIQTAAGGTITIHGAYGFTEDGTLFGVITEVEKKGTDSGPAKGELFGFKCKVAKDVLTLSDYRSSVDRPEGKAIIEGDYKKK